MSSVSETISQANACPTNVLNLSTVSSSFCIDLHLPTRIVDSTKKDTIRERRMVSFAGTAAV